jgi:hypothetical protein|tara:strand:+ start:35 stop:211 length:177 start_codon:yes stop_codon:yes gene_type:complete
MKEIKKSIWKSRPDDTYNFEHIVKILIQRDGWIRIPLFTGKEKLSEEKWWERIKDVRF